MQMTIDQLIATYVEEAPHRPGPADARLRDACVPVWTIVGYWRAAGGDAERVAADCEIPRDAVEAAVACCKRNRSVIDGKLAANSDEPMIPGITGGKPKSRYPVEWAE